MVYLQKIPNEHYIPYADSYYERLLMVPVKHSAGFLTETGSIHVDHPNFEANIVHECMENHISTAQNRQISSLLAFRKKKKKGQSGHLRLELFWFFCLIKLKVECQWAKELKGKWEIQCALLQNRAKSHLEKNGLGTC